MYVSAKKSDLPLSSANQFVSSFNLTTDGFLKVIIVKQSKILVYDKVYDFIYITLSMQ